LEADSEYTQTAIRFPDPKNALCNGNLRIHNFRKEMPMIFVQFWLTDVEFSIGGAFSYRHTQQGGQPPGHQSPAFTIRLAHGRYETVEVDLVARETFSDAKRR
jgi:hypothetical protein